MTERYSPIDGQRFARPSYMSLNDRGALGGYLGKYGEAIVLQTLLAICRNNAKLEWPAPFEQVAPAPDANDYLLERN
jgi:hypothetical protein